MPTENGDRKPDGHGSLRYLLAHLMERAHGLLGIVDRGITWAARTWSWFRSMAGPATESIRGDFSKTFRHFSGAFVLRVAVAFAVALYLLSGTYIVDTGEEALVLRFGEIVREGIGEGIRYRLPWPFEQEMLVNVAEIRREGLGMQIPEHRRIHPAEVIQVVSGDENIIDLKFIMQYRVKDPAGFLFNVDYPSYLVVRDAAKSAIAELAGKMGVDELLTIGKSELKRRVESTAQMLLDQQRSGIALVNASIREAAPPEKAAGAFRDVTSAREDRARSINAAQGYANSVIPRARGEARKLIQEARAYRASLINRARGEAGAFAEMLAEYGRNRRIYTEDVTRQRLYLETMEKVLNQVKKIVMSTEKGRKVQIRLVAGRAVQLTE